MNGSPQMSQYVFDPATQRYTMKTPAEQAREQQKRSGLGGLYDGGSSDGMSPQGPVGFGMMGPGMAEMGVGAQNMGLALSGIPSIATQVAGAVASGIGNSMMGSQVSPVANPSMSVTSVAPTPGFATPAESLATMNAQMAAQQQAEAEQAEAASAMAAAPGVADAVASEATDAMGNATSPGDAPSDSGADGGGGGGGGGDGGGNAAGDASAGAGDSSGEREGGMIYQKRYAEGGLASAAQHVQSQGRGEDKVLVHMTPGEVRGLQAIAMQHGGSLTINPKTGLVEANFLRSILPVIAGAALAATGVGAPMAALMVGGGTTLFTGSLEKGLMAGLGAFGGAGLGAGLGAAGATAPAVTGTTAGLSAQGAAGAQMAASAAPTGFQAALPGLGVQTGATTAGASLAPASSTAALQAAASGAPQGFAANLSQMGTGFSNVIQGTPGAREAFMQSAGGVKGLATKAGMAAAPMMFSAEEPDTGGSKPQEYIRPYGFDFNRADTEPGFKYRTGEKGESTAEQRYLDPTFTPMGVFKAGTEPGPSFYGTPTAEQYALYSGPKGSPTDVIPEGQLGSGLQRFQPGFNEFLQTRAGQGFSTGGVAGLGKGGLRDGAFIVPADVVAHLGNGSNDAGQKILARGLGARPIKGKGDGMSDSIPTSIEGKQPAKVADGEAYIPPEVVKKVGSKRLYDMMAKIRKARTNTTRQAPEVDPRKFMPA